jgi:glycosidase
MPWRAEGDAAGFSKADADALWLPIGEDNRKRSVEAQMDDDGSILALYRRLLALRRRTPALHSGRYRPLSGHGVPEGVFAYVREHREQRVAVAINFTDEAMKSPLPTEGRVLASSLSPERADESVSNALRLEAHEAVVASLSA